MKSINYIWINLLLILDIQVHCYSRQLDIPISEEIIDEIVFQSEANRGTVDMNNKYNQFQQYIKDYTSFSRNEAKGDLNPPNQNQAVKLFQSDKYLLHRRIISFGDNYQESTSPRIPNLVPIIINGNYKNSENIVGRPHDVWINFLNGSTATGLKDLEFQLNLVNYGIPFSTARQQQGDCDVIVEIFKIDWQECQQLFNGIRKQVEQYILQYQEQGQLGRIPLETQLIVSGSIDIINSRPEELYYDTLPQQIAESLKAAIDLLLQAGAKDIKVANLPPLYMTPYALSRSNNGKEKVKELVFKVNHQISNMIKQNYQGSRAVKLIDFHGVLVGAIWEAEGLDYDVNILLPQSSKEPLPDSNKPTFWVDAIHPVSLGHQLIARNIARHLLT